jgi:hypothetical protein
VNIWIVVGGVVAVALLALVVVGTRRPRSAEDELSQPKPPTARVETPGSLNQALLDQASVRDLLRSIHRAFDTGTLQLTAGGRTASLYFLFGHLFHAVSDTLTGEAAVRDCLDWRDIQYAFDKKSPLPTTETIERPIDEILA